MTSICDGGRWELHIFLKLGEMRQGQYYQVSESIIKYGVPLLNYFLFKPRFVNKWEIYIKDAFGGEMIIWTASPLEWPQHKQPAVEKVIL